MSKILKWAVYIGAAVIAILFLLVFYVSSKVKSELEHNLNGYVHYFNQQYTDMLHHANRNDAEVKLAYFVCKGMVNYDCKTSLDVILDKQTQGGFKVKDLNLSFSDIRTNSMKIGLSGVIENVNTLETESAIVPKNFALSSVLKIIDRQKGQMENATVLKFQSNAMKAKIEAGYGMRDLSLANKNIIKVIQTILAESGGLSNLDLEFMIKNFALKLEGKNIREVFANILKAQNDLEYDKKVDSMIWLVGGMLPSFGFRDSANISALQTMATQLSKFLKSQDDNFLFNLEARDEVWGRLSDFNEINLEHFIQNLDQHFIFKAMP